jgi:hypothetical protein
MHKGHRLVVGGENANPEQGVKNSRRDGYAQTVIKGVMGDIVKKAAL